MSRAKREPIEWEDTLDQKEKEYIEKITAQNRTIEALKAALKANTLKSLLSAVSLKHLPSEFKVLEEELHARVSALIRQEAKLEQLELRGSYTRKGLSATVKQATYPEILDIDFKCKIVDIDENKWVSMFRSWRDEKAVAKELAWINDKLNMQSSKKAQSPEADEKRQKLVDERLNLTKWLTHWEENNNAPSLPNLIKEIDRLVELLTDHGFVVNKSGFKAQSHYVFKTPFRWEEDHWNELTKWQKRFARQTNQAVGDMCHTHYGSLVTNMLHSLLTIDAIDNEYTLGWYERRLTETEWHDLSKALSYGGFKVSRSSECTMAVDEWSGNTITFYPNGHFHIQIPEDADSGTLEARLGIYPLISSPSFKFWTEILVRNTTTSQR